ncbi:cytochrome P450 [Mycobacterium sp. M23085]|uniref:cytochrome P450 n=1 Tax=Mycobacterium sp. M23085 TaxID=3378087 RepID=UPI003878262E
MSGEQVLELDLTDTDLYRNGFPHEVFSELRRRGKIFRHPRVRVERFDTEIEFWAVVSHAEIQQANRDWETFSAFDGHSIVPQPPERRGKMLITMDPPKHSRMRRLISAGFTPRMISSLEDRIRQRTAKILDDVADRREIDFVSEIAFQLPMNVIGDIVGIPEDERPEVFHNADVVMRALDPTEDVSMADRQQAELGLFEFAHRLTLAKRAQPTDDVWSILVGGELDELELGLFFLILSLAGSETTRNGLAQGLMALIAHPEQFADLARDPNVAETATEEILRWTSPVICFGRTVTRDVELGGQQLRAGDRIGIFYPSANRDEAVFDDPFAFDIRRTPNPHVSFGGGGPHFCLGASLARTQIRVMLSAIAKRYPGISLVGQPTWISTGPVNNVGVAVKSLLVRLN